MESGRDKGVALPDQTVTIALDDHDEELAVLGSRDQHLRQLRDAFGVKALARHGAVKLEGEAERVEAAQSALKQLRALYRRRRRLTVDDVAEVFDASLRQGILEANHDSILEIRHGSRMIRPRTDGQNTYLDALMKRDLVFCIGPAGTGKTYLAVAMAVSALRQGVMKKIVLCRPAVEAGENLGYLPGDLEAKINPYLRPLFDALHDLMDYNQIRRYMANDLIEIAPLAYMRGRTLNDAVIILDEGQNASIPQMKMFLTRMGRNARIVVTGDTTQVDLPASVPSGLADAVRRLGQVEGVAIVRLGRSDIVRHPLVQAIVDAYDEEGDTGDRRGDQEDSAADPNRLATPDTTEALADPATTHRKSGSSRPVPLTDPALEDVSLHQS